MQLFIFAHGLYVHAKYYLEDVQTIFSGCTPVSKNIYMYFIHVLYSRIL